jgi:hypothetical protein
VPLEFSQNFAVAVFAQQNLPFQSFVYNIRHTLPLQSLVVVHLKYVVVRNCRPLGVFRNVSTHACDVVFWGSYESLVR